MRARECYSHDSKMVPTRNEMLIQHPISIELWRLVYSHNLAPSPHLSLFRRLLRLEFWIFVLYLIPRDFSIGQVLNDFRDFI